MSVLPKETGVALFDGGEVEWGYGGCHDEIVFINNQYAAASGHKLRALIIFSGECSFGRRNDSK